MIAPVTDPPFKTDAALYFLEGGHYLFRITDKGQTRSKFVTSQDVAAAFSQQEQDTGWLPAGIVRAGHSSKGGWFVYSTPPQTVEIHLEGDSDESLKVPIPRLVLLGVGASYSLWAAKTAHFDPQAKVCQAPFPNIYPDGRICWGQNVPPQAKPEIARQVWELFFATPFNRDLAVDKSARHGDDVRLLLRELAGKSRYPLDDLVGGDRASIEWLITRRLED